MAYDRVLTTAKIALANEAGIKDLDLIGRLKIGERHFYFCKAGDRGLSPRKLAVIDDMIEERTGFLSQQPSLNFTAAFEEATPIDTPGSTFDMRILKKRNERVWMVEIQPKEDEESTSDWLLTI
jgi:hypothetical protein